MKNLGQKKVVAIEDRIPKLKQRRKQRANRRLIFYLSFFFLLIISVLYSQSSLSKVGSIKITGNQYISEQEVIDNAGIKMGTSFWKIDKEKIKNNLTKHVEINTVYVEKKLPNHLVVTVKEFDRVAYIMKEGSYLPVIETGEIITKNDNDPYPVDAPTLVNWDDDRIELITKELMKIPHSISKLISEIHYTPNEYDPNHITLYMSNGYEVRATIRGLSKNIIAYPSIMSELDPTLKGYIELDVVPTFKPYEVESKTEEQEMVTNESEG